MGSMNSLTRNLITGWSLGLPLLSPSPEQEAAFERHVALILARTGRFVMGWAVVMIFLFWPTDLLLLHRLPAALPSFVVLRGVLLITSLGVLLALWRRQEVPPRAQPFFVAPWIVSCAAMGCCLGTLGGLESPWFHFTYLCVTLTIFFPVRPVPRIAYAVLVAVALLVGYGLAQPGMLRSPFFAPTAGFLLFVVLGSVAFGQLLFLLTRSNFFQAQALKRSAAELSSQVVEQTRELRQLTAHLGEVLEAERAHISRELHDELGQELTAMRYELRFARQRFEQDPVSIRGNLANLEDLLLRTARTTRAIVTDLRPRILDDMGLCAAAEWLVERTGQRTGLPCVLRVEGHEPPGLPSEVATAAFRVLQEALTNAARHAAAGRLDVNLCFSAGEVEVLVHDDGIGIAPAEGRSTGMGLIGMRERARALGGQLVVAGEPGRGTQIRCRLPLVGVAP